MSATGIAGGLRLADFTLDPATGVRVLPLATTTSYRDGAEQYLIDSFAAVEDRSVGSEAIAALVHDWPSLYHLSPYRSTLFDALGLDGLAGARVLELGAGCGPVTRWLGERGAEVHAIEGGLSRAEVARARTADLDGVEVYAGNFSALDEPGGFDLVTLIGVLEYSHLYHPEHSDPAAAAAANLDLAVRALGDEGVLVLAIENRMGLKYLNGATEDHSGRLYEGIEGYPQPGSPVTWSLRELHKLLGAAGFGQIDTLVPYPDYKLATTIVNPERCGDGEHIHNWLLAPAPDRGGARRPTTYSESLAIREVARAGLLAELANSHLVVAYRGDAGASRERLGIDLGWSARHYSLDRRPGLRKRLTLRDGVVACDTRPLGEPESEVAAVRSALAVHGIGFAAATEAHVPGELAILDVFSAIAAEGLGPRYDTLLREQRAWLIDTFGAGNAGELPLVRGEAFDATWWNLVLDPATGGRVFIDREWVLAHPIPADYVLWRMLTVFFTHHAVQLGPGVAGRDVEELVADGLRRAGAIVGEAQLTAFRETERALLRGIQAGPLPEGECEPLARWGGLLDAPRSFTVLAFADEVAERPGLLAAYAAQFGAGDAATLVLYAPGADEAAAGAIAEAAIAAAGLGEDAPDMMLLTAPATDGSEAAIAAAASALLTERRGGGAFALLPRCGAADAAELRPFAEAVWAGR
jgi:2-polyprenyl-3-methyl-5-hydroxy-6-metoxy-1,4-benzoquinol methylase